MKIQIQIVIFLFAICAESISAYGRRIPIFPKQHRNVEAQISYKTYWYPQTVSCINFVSIFLYVILTCFKVNDSSM